MLKEIDGSIPTPFRCLVAGPSGSGKSTFVRDLVRNQQKIFSKKFSYLYIFTGSPKENDDILRSLETDPTISHVVKVFDINKMYFSSHASSSDKKPICLENTDFASHLMSLLNEHKKEGQEGCIVFDDLMEELADCGILTHLFSKVSHHSLVSVIHITQNLFHKGHGKRAGMNVTVFRNNQILVLFRSPMDNSVFSIVAQRLRTGGLKSSELSEMLFDIAEQHDYVMIVPGKGFDQQQLQFRTDIFATEPFPHQKIFNPQEWKKMKKRKGSDDTLVPTKRKRVS